MANTFASWDPNSGSSLNDFLYQQIAAQKMAGLGSWSGGLDPETSMRSMAMDLEKSGITSLGQLGWSDRAERLGWTSGARQVSSGSIDDLGYWDPGIDENHPVYGRFVPGIINKDTGKLLHSAYGERTMGNTWSGSYAGKGNTGFDINFDAEGNPVFGTHGASSVQSKDWMPAAFLLAAAGGVGASALFGGAGAAGAAGAGAVATPVTGWGAGAAAATELGALGGASGGAAALGAGELLTGGSALEQLALGGAAADTVGTGTAFELANAGASAMTDLGTAGAASGDVLGDFIASLGAQEPFVQGGAAAYTGPMSLGWDGAGATGTSSWVDSITKALGYTNADGSLNKAALLKSLMSVGSGLYGMNQAGDLARLSGQAISGSAPWTTSGGTALAGEELKRAISGDLSNDPGFKLAQQAAARASSQQPGGMAASAAAMAALKYQNDRIAALSGPAGVGFNPGQGYSTALTGTGAASNLASSSLGSIGYGGTSSQMPPWLQQFLIKQGMGA